MVLTRKIGKKDMAAKPKKISSNKATFSLLPSQNAPTQTQSGDAAAGSTSPEIFTPPKTPSVLPSTLATAAKKGISSGSEQIRVDWLSRMAPPVLYFPPTSQSNLLPDNSHDSDGTMMVSCQEYLDLLLGKSASPQQHQPAIAPLFAVGSERSACRHSMRLLAGYLQECKESILLSATNLLPGMPQTSPNPSYGRGQANRLFDQRLFIRPMSALTEVSGIISSCMSMMPWPVDALDEELPPARDGLPLATFTRRLAHYWSHKLDDGGRAALIREELDAILSYMLTAAYPVPNNLNPSSSKRTSSSTSGLASSRKNNPSTPTESSSGNGIECLRKWAWCPCEGCSARSLADLDELRTLVALGYVEELDRLHQVYSQRQNNRNGEPGPANHHLPQNNAKKKSASTASKFSSVKSKEKGRKDTAIDENTDNRAGQGEAWREATRKVIYNGLVQFASAFAGGGSIASHEHPAHNPYAAAPGGGAHDDPSAIMNPERARQIVSDYNSHKRAQRRQQQQPTVPVVAQPPSSNAARLNNASLQKNTKAARKEEEHGDEQEEEEGEEDECSAVPCAKCRALQRRHQLRMRSRNGLVSEPEDRDTDEFLEEDDGIDDEDFLRNNDDEAVDCEGDLLDEEPQNNTPPYDDEAEDDDDEAETYEDLEGDDDEGILSTSSADELFPGTTLETSFAELRRMRSANQSAQAQQQRPGAISNSPSAGAAQKKSNALHHPLESSWRPLVPVPVYDSDIYEARFPLSSDSYSMQPMMPRFNIKPYPFGISCSNHPDGNVVRDPGELEGQRLFHLLASELFSNRLTQSYLEHVLKERQAALLAELEAQEQQESARTKKQPTTASKKINKKDELNKKNEHNKKEEPNVALNGPVVVDVPLLVPFESENNNLTILTQEPPSVLSKTRQDDQDDVDGGPDTDSEVALNNKGQGASSSNLMMVSVDEDRLAKRAKAKNKKKRRKAAALAAATNSTALNNAKEPEGNNEGLRPSSLLASEDECEELLRATMQQLHLSDAEDSDAEEKNYFVASHLSSKMANSSSNSLLLWASNNLGVDGKPGGSNKTPPPTPPIITSPLGGTFFGPGLINRILSPSSTSSHFSNSNGMPSPSLSGRADLPPPPGLAALPKRL